MAEKILQAINIGRFRLQNPAVFGPHRVNFPEGHLPGAKRIAYYEERAKGGVGMIITEGAMVLPGEYPYDWALNVYESDAVPAFSKLAAAIHKYETVLIGSLNLCGMQGDSSVTRRPLLAPSAVAEVNSNEIPKVIDADDFKAIRRGYEFGAAVLHQAGFDGVEINAGQSSLLRQFLSGLTNFRSDEYGGSLENKCRLTVEVLRAARAVIGENKILGLRICADEYAPWGGIQPAEARELVKYITDQIRVDYVAFENGSIFTANMTMAGCNQPEDYALAAAKEAGSKIPYLRQCVGGSLVSPAAIAKALEDFALVDITRTLIADPQFIEKIRSGNEKAITPCILCKEGCHTQANTNPVVACAMNPIAGEEHKFEPIKIFSRKRLAVAGSGPAGLQAALTALQSGHIVTLYEKNAELGGHFRQFAENSGCEYYGRVLKYFTANLEEFERDGLLTVELNHEMTAAEAENFDAVIVASGADYTPSEYAGDALSVSLDDILSGKIPEGSRAVVEDTLGDNRCITACRILKKAGYDLTLVTKDAYFAAQLVKIGEFSQWYGEMGALGITQRSNSYIGYAGKDKLEIVNKYNEETETLPGVDITLKIASPRVNNMLWQELQAAPVMKILIGDAVAPRNLQAAIREGYQAIKELR